MYDYDPSRPFNDTETIEGTPGLGEAYAVADSALEEGLGMDHWRAQIKNLVISIPSDSEDSDSDLVEDTDDSEFWEAIRQSREFYSRETSATTSAHLPKSSLSRLQDNQESVSGLIGTCSNDRDSETELPSTAMSAFHCSPRTSHPVRDQTNCNAPIEPSSSKHAQSSRVCKQKDRQDRPNSHSDTLQAISGDGDSPHPMIRSNPNDLLNFSRLDQESYIPTSDAVDGDL